MILPSFSSASDFEGASQAVLSFLHDRLGFDLWMVTRTEGKDWIVLQAKDHGYGVESGNVFQWADSFCSRMVAGHGPRIAPRSSAIPAYIGAPIGRRVKIGAYVGVPITRPDGSLFGTLCAIDPAPQPEAITKDLPLIELLAGLLSSVLTLERSAEEAVLRAERARPRSSSETDAMTGKYNRGGWVRLLRAEEARCARYGLSACVITVELRAPKSMKEDAAIDNLICAAGSAIRAVARDTDIVARVGPEEFAVLGAQCDLAGTEQLLQKIRRALTAANISAYFGCAMRMPGTGLEGAWREAGLQRTPSRMQKRPGQPA